MPSYQTTTPQPGLARTLAGANFDDSPAAASAVSWGAIVAGAAAAAALSLILLMLGSGLGLSSVSPWAHDGIGAATFGASTILWVTFTQLLASGMGGYLAGRLRTRWIDVASDEVYFRDTAHGFLAWAVASLATAALLTSVIGSIVSGGLRAGAEVAGTGTMATTAAAASGAAAATAQSTANGEDGALGYFVDSLFRKAAAPAQNVTTPIDSAPPAGVAAQPAIAAPGAEITRIFMHTMRSGPLPAEDLWHVGQLVAQHTGLPQAEAQKRVFDTYARAQATLREAENTARAAADKARKAASYAALWLFVSLLIGAFVASLAATYGGRQRDE